MPEPRGLSWDEAHRILALIDDTEGHNVDLTVDGLRVRVEAMPASAPVSVMPETIPEPEEEAEEDETSAIVAAPRTGAITLAPGIVAGASVAAGHPLAHVGAEGAVVSEVGGTVDTVFVVDGDLVEYGQVLLVVRPAQRTGAAS